MQPTVLESVYHKVYPVTQDILKLISSTIQMFNEPLQTMIYCVVAHGLASSYEIYFKHACVHFQPPLMYAIVVDL